ALDDFSPESLHEFFHGGNECLSLDHILYPPTPPSDIHGSTFPISPESFKLKPDPSEAREETAGNAAPAGWSPQKYSLPVKTEPKSRVVDYIPQDLQVSDPGSTRDSREKRKSAQLSESPSLVPLRHQLHGYQSGAVVEASLMGPPAHSALYQDYDRNIQTQQQTQAPLADLSADWLSFEQDDLMERKKARDSLHTIDQVPQELVHHAQSPPKLPVRRTIWFSKPPTLLPSPIQSPYRVTGVTNPFTARTLPHSDYHQGQEHVSEFDQATQQRSPDHSLAHHIAIQGDIEMQEKARPQSPVISETSVGHSVIAQQPVLIDPSQFMKEAKSLRKFLSFGMNFDRATLTNGFENSAPECKQKLKEIFRLFSETPEGMIVIPESRFSSFYTLFSNLTKEKASLMREKRGLFLKIIVPRQDLEGNNNLASELKSACGTFLRLGSSVIRSKERIPYDRNDDVLTKIRKRVQNQLRNSGDGVLNSALWSFLEFWMYIKRPSFIENTLGEHQKFNVVAKSFFNSIFILSPGTRIVQRSCCQSGILLRDPVEKNLVAQEVLLTSRHLQSAWFNCRGASLLGDPLDTNLLAQGGFLSGDLMRNDRVIEEEHISSAIGGGKSRPRRRSRRGGDLLGGSTSECGESEGHSTALIMAIDADDAPNNLAGENLQITKIGSVGTWRRQQYPAGLGRV
ncbi:hypothetical protein MJO29_004546, partial [Puccinia striiformis f. sp. tritici]